MDYVAYNYFPPNKEEYIRGMVQAIFTSEIELTHLGKNDPPKKWSGNREELLNVLSQGNDKTNVSVVRTTLAEIDVPR